MFKEHQITYWHWHHLFAIPVIPPSNVDYRFGYHRGWFMRWSRQYHWYHKGLRAKHPYTICKELHHICGICQTCLNHALRTLWLHNFNILWISRVPRLQVDSHFFRPRTLGATHASHSQRMTNSRRTRHGARHQQQIALRSQGPQGLQWWLTPVSKMRQDDGLSREKVEATLRNA